MRYAPPEAVEQKIEVSVGDGVDADRRPLGSYQRTVFHTASRMNR